MVSTILARHFKNWGITHVFGIPGKPVVPLLMELEEQGVQFVLTRHESGAGFAASGYALLQEGLGVAIGTSGPGGTNLLTAAGQAKAYHIPTLFITGHPSSKDTGKAMGQDSSMFGTDLVKMFEPVTLFSARIERGDQIELLLRHAIEKATAGVKGPVHLSISMDVLFEEIPPFILPLPSQQSLVVSNQLDNMISRLSQSKKTVLFLGKGVHLSRAYKEVQWLAEHWQMPVVTSPGGKGTFPTNHPLSLGSFGLGGQEEATRYLEGGVDELVVVGSKLSDMSIAGLTESMYPKHVIHFDVDLTFMNKSLQVSTLMIQGDAKENLVALQRLTKEMDHKSSPIEEVNFPKEKSFEPMRTLPYVSAETATTAVRSAFPPETIFFGDDGSHTFYAIKHLDLPQAGTFFFDDVFGTMGHAIGYSIGGKLGTPEKTIACLTGDGCMYMHGTEIATAVDQKLPVIFIVFNNKQLDMVDKGMKQWLGKSVGATYSKGLDVVSFAQSLGAQAYHCESELDIQKAIYEAMTITDCPSVIEVMVDPDEIPPTLKRV